MGNGRLVSWEMNLKLLIFFAFFYGLTFYILWTGANW